MVCCQLHASVAFFQSGVLYKLERRVYVLTRLNATKNGIGIIFLFQDKKRCCPSLSWPR